MYPFIVRAGTSKIAESKFCLFLFVKEQVDLIAHKSHSFAHYDTE
jgi:hypothetical protein